ncbi:MAG TPA: amino acid permease [Thermodesulfobacteriota bacterium]|nr:amino acid permease [Thermodesulfobacteriota bacterium]
MNHKNVGNGLKREIGFFSATILVVANMIGTGIFTTSGFIIQELGSPGALLLCWIVGGIFALSGALCYGELGAMFPLAGGEYVYLRESFGKLMAFLSGWISLIVGFSAPIAAAAIAFATYFFRAFPNLLPLDLNASLGPSSSLIVTPVTMLASVMIIIFSLIHSHSLWFGSRVQNVLTTFKLLLIVSFVVGGFFMGKGSMPHLFDTLHPTSIFSGSFAVSLIFISFAYSGWNAAAYLGSEIKNPARNIPFSLLTGTFLVMLLYLLLNLTYLYALTVPEMSGVLEVGAKAAVALFGGQVSYFVAGAIAISLLSVISAMILAGPRVYYAMAQDGVFIKLLAHLRGKHQTPAYAIALQGIIAIIMVITASFEKLLIYIGFTLSVFAVLTVCGLIILRKRNYYRQLAYQTWGYPLTPMVFIVGNLWIIFYSLKDKPLTSAWGLVTIVLGGLVYLFIGRRAKLKHQSYAE